MSVTGRLPPQKSNHGGKSEGAKGDFLSTYSGLQVARQSRVRELRQLVASGRYRVDSEKLAVSILCYALKETQPRR